MPSGQTIFFLNLETSDGLRSQSEAPNIQNVPSFLKICTSPSDKKNPVSYKMAGRITIYFTFMLILTTAVADIQVRFNTVN